MPLNVTRCSSACRTLLSGLFLTVLTASALAAPPGGEWTYDVYRDNDVIGTHQLAFTDWGGNLHLTVHTRIAVKMMYVVVYRFEQDGTEDWSGGQLSGMTTSTNDDGKRHEISLHRDGDHVRGLGDGHRVHAPGDVLTGSLWNEELVKKQVLLNTINGELMKISVLDLGMQPVDTASGQSVTAHHYKITGDLEREIWFAPDGRMIQLAFLGQDGSHIRYRIR